MKKILTLILVFLLATLPVFAEGGIQVAALKGPTAMGMVGMMRDCADVYDFTLAGAADEITPLLIQGKLDIAAVPANLASVLYNKTEGQIEVLGINTLGVLYIVECGETVQSIADLKGKTLYSAGKGATPEYALNAILRANALDPETDLTIEYKSEHAECLAALMADPNAVAMLPQPFATVAQSKAEGMRIALDLNAEWTNVVEGAPLVTGVVIARKAFVDEQPEAIKQFLSDYAVSVELVQNDVPTAASLIGEYDIFEAAVAEKALPFCNIVLMTGDELKSTLSGYLAVLFEQEPASVGGKLPEDAFYYAE